jgi:acetyltransferase
LVRADLPEYAAPERAVGALKAMWDYAEWCRMPPRVVARFPVNRRRVERVLNRCRRTGEICVNEAAAKEIMRAYCFNVPEGAVAASPDEAVAAAVKLGFPVAMKILSTGVTRKADSGGVRLGLATPRDVSDAYDLMMLHIGRQLPDARLDGVYLERMCPPDREVILGMTRDPQFGPMLMFGLGGIFVEVMKDVAFHLAPITAQEALEMLRNTKSYALLEGARGAGSADVRAIADCLQRLSQLVTDFPLIEEMEINPLVVGQQGSDPMVAAARITLAPPPGSPPG